ncbi:hypothetical protein [Variovorax paradoxus]|uniref:hypothetical protein n=1 Tax=Variovorax paradoxus TaxID=34073 RepID=UPI0029C7753F|nr:hypothetical protein RZE77_31325 [Variovorax paradoxus]
MRNDLDNIGHDGKYQQAVAAFRSSVSSARSCRLVHYVGVGKPNGKDVEASEVETEIAGCLAEGFYVDCFYESGRLFILVQEPGCPIPTWEQVIAEEAMVDVDALLEAARLRGEL